MSSLPPDQDEPAWYKCRHCDDQFKREDHLRRHELSHGFPRFLCDHPACGMRFHRKDVLQRHKLVHQPNPLKRRRKPRRGAIPRGPIQQTSDSSTTPPGDFSPPPVAHAHAHAQAHVQVPLPALTPPAASTASQSPPHDLHQLAAQGDSFNLTTEWDYAIHEWPEFGLHPGLPNFVQPSWQNCLMPVFDTTSSPLIPPSLALAHAPNASFPLDAAFVPHPALPLSPQDMRICVDKFRQRFLPRIPFLHYLTCEHECVSQKSALYYTMAMAGSLYLDNYRPKAARMHKLASETLQKQSRMANPSLQDFQANILIIDFAVWYGNEEMRRWASREKHALAQALIEFVSTSLPPLSYDDWGRWRLREEIKRTGFAFFVNCVMQSTFYGHDTPILASAIELSLPSPESIWEATSEAEWQTQVELLGLREKSEIIFPVAAHAILSQDTEYSTDYELATLFGQFILLCVIMDSYNAAAKLPTNYLTSMD
ncbi:putative zinc finger c2h2-type protein [Diplodia seriata]|uniref:Putative zinc finger c2h2-type protein n=1 Tax=Diplodia seriata TaxID=420778 RepID=A0A0G2EK31_9PEZI|nr:putative zinc finger c2h2-type protein [Diplodia seriata]